MIFAHFGKWLAITRGKMLCPAPPTLGQLRNRKQPRNLIVSETSNTALPIAERRPRRPPPPCQPPRGQEERCTSGADASVLFGNMDGSFSPRATLVQKLEAIWHDATLARSSSLPPAERKEEAQTKVSWTSVSRVR